MAETSWPFDNANTNETQYSRIFRELIETGVLGTPAGSELKPFGDSSGMQIKVPVGFAFVRGHFYYNDATKTIAVAAAGTQPRTDLIVVELDPTANTIIAKVITGNPANYGADPEPLLTKTDTAVYQLLLGTIDVGANVSTITASNVADRRTFTSSGWGLWTNARRPPSPRIGKAGFNTTTGKPEYWNGSTWSDFTPSSLPASIISDPQNLVVGDSAKVGGNMIKVQQADPGSVPNGTVWIGW